MDETKANDAHKITKKKDSKPQDTVGSSYPEDYQIIDGELWTARQRQMSSLHEISYRACFKAELPEYFITRYAAEQDVVYDPFAGRGTTAVQAALMGRRFIANDINPLMQILARPRVEPPTLRAVELRLEEIDLTSGAEPEADEPDLSVFYNQHTLEELRSLRRYLDYRRRSGLEDALDEWIRMVATNRLTGHSKGFFSVYTLPPNQAVTSERQKMINERYHNDFGIYRNVKSIILKKSKALLKEIPHPWPGKGGVFLNQDAANTYAIEDSTVNLIITSPPFLDTVQYRNDNWLRCWFNHIDTAAVAARMTNLHSLEQWAKVMTEVFLEFKRIMVPGAYGAFEVGEVRGGKIELDKTVFEIIREVGLIPQATYINRQQFTKTANIWGVANNLGGTNSNRIVVFRKGIE